MERKRVFEGDRVFFEVFDCFSGFGIVKSVNEDGVFIDADLDTIHTVYANQHFEGDKLSFYRWEHLYALNVTGEAKYRQDIKGFITLMENGVSYSVWSVELTTEEKDIISRILKEHETEGGSKVCEKKVAFASEPTRTNFAMIRALDVKRLAKKSPIVDKEEIDYIEGVLQLGEMSTLALHNLRDFVVLYFTSRDEESENSQYFDIAMSKITAVIDDFLFRNGGEV